MDDNNEIETPLGEEIDGGNDQYQDEGYDDFNPIEQGMYDDDPSPYDGTYSEM